MSERREPEVALYIRFKRKAVFFWGRDHLREFVSNVIPRTVPICESSKAFSRLGQIGARAMLTDLHIDLYATANFGPFSERGGCDYWYVIEGTVN